MPEQESLLRISFFLATFFLLVAAEWHRPRRKLGFRLSRWVSNLGLVGLSTVLVRIVLPVAAVGWAVQVGEHDWGVLNQTAWPAWVEGMAAFVALDFAIFAQHWATHHVPALWRLHRVHHSDLDVDASTGVRFHPVEILLSMLWKMGVVTVLGAGAVGVLVFEIVLSSSSLWEHANVRLSSRMDRLLRSVIVTPDMHRVHHSWYPDETNSNYGFNFSFWDRLFRTYHPQPRDGHEDMTLGLKEFRRDEAQRLTQLLVQPLQTEGR
jgi:sterol desaturase/sphingolipid hydroxylase (fatty acid hydroxylase superfamily)